MGLIYADKVRFVKDDSHPLGEYKAFFATSSELAKAFGSAAAAPGLTSKGGIIQMGRDQINQRITQLGGDPDDTGKDAKLNEKLKGPVGELRKGLAAIERVSAAPQAAARQQMAARM